MTDDEKRANPRCISCGERQPLEMFINATNRRQRRNCRTCVPKVILAMKERGAWRGELRRNS